MEKRIRDLDSINPLFLRIEDISKLPEDIPVNGKRLEDGLQLEADKSTKEITISENRDKMMNEMREMLEDKMAPHEVETLMNELFTETFEQDSWLNQYQKPEKLYQHRK